MARVLLADGDMSHAFTRAIALKRLGVGVDRAADGETACAMARQTRYDLILLDTDLPGPAGRSVCRELRGHGVSAMVVLMADESTPLPDLAEIGADARMPKSLDLDEFAA